MRKIYGERGVSKWRGRRGNGYLTRKRWSFGVVLLGNGRGIGEGQGL